jgi:small subunit ribosomal protein S20
MAHSKSAIKRIRQTRTRRYYNRTNKRDMKLAIRSVVEAENYESALESFKKATSVVDRVTARGVIHKNKAARVKSSLWKQVKALQG